MAVLRLLFGVVLGIVAVLIFTGVDVLATEMLSGSESESWTFGQTGYFLFKGAISLSNSFWFSASILVRSVIISLLEYVFISSRFSGSILGLLLGPARFSVVLFIIFSYGSLKVSRS